MNWGPAPPERRPITSSMDQPSSIASLRAATAAWNGFGAVDHACGIPAALDARRAPASASARGEPACVLKPVGDASSIRAIAALNRCNAARARSAPGPSMAASVVVAAMKEAACRQRCGAKSIRDGCGSEAGGGPVRVVMALRIAQGSSLRGVEAAAVCAVAGAAVAVGCGFAAADCAFSPAGCVFSPAGCTAAGAGDAACGCGGATEPATAAAVVAASRMVATPEATAAGTAAVRAVLAAVSAEAATAGILAGAGAAAGAVAGAGAAAEAGAGAGVAGFAGAKPGTRRRRAAIAPAPVVGATRTSRML